MRTQHLAGLDWPFGIHTLWDRWASSTSLLWFTFPVDVSAKRFVCHFCPLIRMPLKTYMAPVWQRCSWTDYRGEQARVCVCVFVCSVSQKIVDVSISTHSQSLLSIRRTHTYRFTWCLRQKRTENLSPWMFIIGSEIYKCIASRGHYANCLLSCSILFSTALLCIHLCCGLHK